MLQYRFIRLNVLFALVLIYWLVLPTQQPMTYAQDENKGYVSVNNIPETVIFGTLLFDNFNDGDYLDGDPLDWSIDWSHSGNPTGNPAQMDFDPLNVVCEDANCYLEGHTTNDPGQAKNTPFIYAANPTNTGRWQFRSRLRSTENDQHNSFYLYNTPRSYDGEGYNLIHWANGDLTFSRRINRQRVTLINQTDLGGQDDQWHIISIERNMGGEWKIFFDGQLVGSIVDLTVTEFPYFLVGRYGSIDNVRVDRLPFKIFLPIVLSNPQ